MRAFCVLFVVGIAASAASLAQGTREWRFEAGAQFTAIRVQALGEKPPGVGGRTSYEFTRGGFVFAPEVEWNYFPQDPSGNFGESQFLTGVSAGVKADLLGIYLKARPGFVRFGGADFKLRNHGSSTNFACDLGAVLEYPTSGRVAVRFDVGDTLIQFSRPVFTGASALPTSPGLSHNFQSAIGVVFRF